MAICSNGPKLITYRWDQRFSQRRNGKPQSLALRTASRRALPIVGHVVPIRAYELTEDPSKAAKPTSYNYAFRVESIQYRDSEAVIKVRLADCDPVHEAQVAHVLRRVHFWQITD
jgi:hypothetical protein